MHVVVRFAGPIRDLAGCAEILALLPEGTSLRRLLQWLRGKLPAPAVQQVLDVVVAEGGYPALLLLNRRHVRTAGELDRALAEGDVIAFVPPMDGG